MAGGLLKAFGGIFLALGILAILVGLIAVGYGLYDENQNHQQSGPFGIGHDRERSDVNEALVMGGAAAAGAGLVVSIVGIILVASGSGRANRAIVKAVANRPPNASVAAPVEATAVPATPAARSQTKWAWMAAGLVAALLLSGVLFIIPGAPLSGSDDVRSRPNQTVGDGPLATASLDGQLSSGPTVLGGSSLLGDGKSAPEFAVPQGAHRLQVKASWSPGSSCCKEIQFYLEKSEGSSWTQVDDHTGPAGTYNVTLDGAAASYRFRAFPGEDGVSTGQSFHIEATSWA